MLADEEGDNRVWGGASCVPLKETVEDGGVVQEAGMLGVREVGKTHGGDRGTDGVEAGEIAEGDLQ